MNLLKPELILTFWPAVIVAVLAIAAFIRVWKWKGIKQAIVRSHAKAKYTLTFAGRYW